MLAQVSGVCTRTMSAPNAVRAIEVISSGQQPQQQHVASAGDDRLVRMWNVETGKYFRSLFKAGFDGRALHKQFAPSVVEGQHKATITSANVANVYEKACGYMQRDLRRSALAFFDSHSSPLVQESIRIGPATTTLTAACLLQLTTAQMLASVIERDTFVESELNVMALVRAWLIANKRSENLADAKLLVGKVRASVVSPGEQRVKLEETVRSVFGKQAQLADAFVQEMQKAWHVADDDKSKSAYRRLLALNVLGGVRRLKAVSVRSQYRASVTNDDSREEPMRSSLVLRLGNPVALNRIKLFLRRKRQEKQFLFLFDKTKVLEAKYSI